MTVAVGVVLLFCFVAAIFGGDGEKVIDEIEYEKKTGKKYGKW